MGRGHKNTSVGSQDTSVNIQRSLYLRAQSKDYEAGVEIGHPALTVYNDAQHLNKQASCLH